MLVVARQACLSTDSRVRDPTCGVIIMLSMLSYGWGEVLESVKSNVNVNMNLNAYAITLQCKVTNLYCQGTELAVYALHANRTQYRVEYICIWIYETTDYHRLLIDDIRAVAVELAGLACISHICFVDQATASSVDDDGACRFVFMV